jgi:hypothetical protein
MMSSPSSLGQTPPVTAVTAGAPLKATQADKVSVKPDSTNPVAKIPNAEVLASTPQNSDAPRGSILDILA